MRLIDADALNCRLTTLDRFCRTDKMSALLGRVLFIVSKMPTAVEVEKAEPIENGDDSYVCDRCGETVGWEELYVFGIDPIKYKYCLGWGRKVKWE